MTRDWRTLVALAAVLAAFMLSLGSPWLLGAALGLAALSWISARWAPALLLSRAVGTVVAVLLIIGSVAVQAPALQLEDMVPAVGVAAAAVLVVRLWSRDLTDDLPTLHLAAVLLALAAFSATSLVPVLLIGLSIPLLMHAELHERVRVDWHAVEGARAAIRQSQASATRPRGSTRALTLATTWLLALSVVGGALVFLGFPRRASSSQWWGTTARSGYTSRVDLSHAGAIQSSRREVLRVVITDPSGEASGALGPLYLRAGTLNRYDGESRTWVWGHEGPSYLHTQPGAWVAMGSALPSEAGGVWRAEMRSRGVRLGALPMPRPAFAIQTPEADVVPIIRSSGDVVMANLPEWEVLFKPYATAADLSLLARDVPWTPRSTDATAFGTATRERARMIEESIPADRDGWNRAAAFAIEARRYLSESPFRYTTDATAQPLRGDPIDSFLTVTQAGHCERFASALVALCQAAGYDARIATGFLATEFNELASFYTVREADAHAWAEVRVGPDRWEVIDPAPVQRLVHERAQSRSWIDSILGVLAPAEEVFTRFIVGFDRRSQLSLSAQLAAWRDELWTRITVHGSQRILEVSAWLAPTPEQAWRARLWLVSLGACVVATGLAALLYTARRERVRRACAPVRSYRSPSVRILRRCAPFATLPARVALACGPRPPGATLLAWVEQAVHANPEARTRLRDEVVAFYDARFNTH